MRRKIEGIFGRIIQDTALLTASFYLSISHNKLKLLLSHHYIQGGGGGRGSVCPDKTLVTSEGSSAPALIASVPRPDRTRREN